MPKQLLHEDKPQQRASDFRAHQPPGRPLEHWKNERAPEKLYVCLTDYAKAFDCVDHNKLWKILQEIGIPDHLTCLLRHLYVGQKATVRTGHGTTDCFQIGKGVRQGCILSPCLFNVYAECIMRNAGLDEAQAEIKTAGRKRTPPLRQKVKD